MSLFPAEYVEARGRYRAFMDEHVYPNEAAIEREDDDALALLAELREKRARGGPLGAARAARGGRDRARLPLLRLPQRGDRALRVRAARVRLPGARRRERGDPAPVRDGRAEGALPAPARRRRDAVVLRDDRARRRRLRPDAAADARGAGRRRLGDRRAQVVLERRRRSRLRRRLRDLGPGCRAAPARDDDPRPRRRRRRRRRPSRPGDGARRPWLEHPLRGALHRRARPGREHARRGGGGVPPRAEAPRPGSHPPRHAVARPDAAGVRAHVPLRERA